MAAIEQASLLRATAALPTPRDHVLYSMALGTGQRLGMLLGLDLGNLSPNGREARGRTERV